MKLIAALAALAAACGSSAPATPDAPVADAAPDGLPADAGPITVNAPYLDASNRITPGAVVLFYDHGGTIVDRVQTGADGRATGIGRRDGMVLVLPPDGQRTEYYSWYGVLPGDELTTQRAPVPAAAAPEGRHASILVARDTQSAGTYAVGTVGMTASKSVGAGSDDIALDAVIDADAPLVNDVVIKYTAGPSYQFQVAHAVALDAGVIDLRGAASQGVGLTYEARATLPMPATWISGYYKALSSGRVLWQEPAFVDTTVTPMALRFASPGAGDGHALAVSYQLNDGRDYPTYALSYNAPPQYLDWSQLAPFAATVVLSADNSVRWDKGTFVGGELGIEVTLSTDRARWHILLPPGEMAFTPPPIPSDVVLPPMMTAVRVSYVGGNDPAGYRALRIDRDVFDLYHWAQVTPATPGVFRFAGT